MDKHITLRIASLALLLLASFPARAQDSVSVEGVFQQWHRISVRVTCPEAVCGLVSETSDPNPFTDYRLRVTFTSPDGLDVLEVPGFYAGDGQAAYSETTLGNVWMAHLTPHSTGDWTYRVSFETGPDLVLDSLAGAPVEPDGFEGAFTVGVSDKTGKDLRGKGILTYAGKNYYTFSGDQTPFLKNGAGSPENLLYYHEFSNTYQQDTIPKIPAHRFGPHVQHFNAGDPLWGPTKSKGQGVIGALNYLQSLDVNSYYFMVNDTALNGNGQCTGIWPWISPAVESRDRFSVAKLAQWEVVFSHMDSLGIAMNMVTQDRINQKDLDEGALGRTRKLFYRELIARFAHHPGLVWNLGEENSATTLQIKDYTRFIRGLDVYQHPIVSQANGTLDAHDRYYTPLLGYTDFEGASLQVGLTDMDSDEPPSPPGRIHDAVLKWVRASAESGRPWVVTLDEIGHWSDGIVPDGDPRDPTNRRARREGFWGTLMAGGAGADWYFGSDPYLFNDIWMEDFQVRAEFFERTRDGVRMIQDSGLPFWEMENLNAIASDSLTWVFGKPGEAYFVYSPYLAPVDLTLPAGSYVVRWYDAFAGGPLQEGTLTEITAATDSARVPIGSPYDFTEDAVAVVTKKPVVASDEDAPRPSGRVILHPPYPNPADASATIVFELLQPGQATLSVFDLLGRRVRVLTSAFHPQGEHRYKVDTSTLPGGMYFYRLDIDGAGSLVQSMPVIHP